MSNIFFYDPEGDSEGDSGVDLSSIDDLVKSAGIYVESGKSLFAYSADNDGVLTGAVFVSTDPFDADIAIRPTAQSQGVGRKLFEVAMDECDMYSAEMDMPALIHATNPIIQRWLFQRDFVVADSLLDGDTIMARDRGLTPNERLSRFTALLSNDAKWQKQYLRSALGDMTFGEFQQALVDVANHRPIATAHADVIATFARSLTRSQSDREYLLAQLSVAQRERYLCPPSFDHVLNEMMTSAPEDVLEVCMNALREKMPEADVGNGVPRLQALTYHWLRNGGAPCGGSEKDAVEHVIDNLPLSSAAKSALLSVRSEVKAANAYKNNHNVSVEPNAIKLR